MAVAQPTRPHRYRVAMPIDEWDLLERYGAAVEEDAAAVFIGAGLSLSQGLPDWIALLKKPRRTAGIPSGLRDLPLVAEYATRSQPGGREALEAHIAEQLDRATKEPSEGHRKLARLPLSEYWTTNYDELIETAAPQLAVIRSESDWLERRGHRRLVKMHGSYSVEKHQWDEPPIITRTDYETYEQKHPRTWAALRSTYLTKSILFLGFSFSDPNIDLMLKLARSLENLSPSEHYTILKRPDDIAGKREHELRVADLERSGVTVCEVNNYDNLTPLLNNLARRTAPPRLYVGGSFTEDSPAVSLAHRIGYQLGSLKNLQLVSLAGPAGLHVSVGFSNAHRDQGDYRAEAAKFHLRSIANRPTKPDGHRIGTIVYDNLETPELRSEVIPNCRAVLIVGGGDRTRAELEMADSLAIPTIPLPTTGGAAFEAYRSLTERRDSLPWLTMLSAADWDLLGSTMPETVAAAAVRLVSQATFLGSKS